MPDAFSAVPFAGNQAAVVLLDDATSFTDDRRQKIAAEMNLAETAFVEADTEHGSGTPADVFTQSQHFKLRWFTPTTEVPLCGHATLAAATVVFQERKNVHETIHFHTKSGQLTVSRAPEAGAGHEHKGSGPPALWLQMRLPLAPPADPLPAPLLQGSALELLQRATVGGYEVQDVAFTAVNNLNYVVLRLKDLTTRAQLESIQPDVAAMQAAVGGEHVHGVIVTCLGGDSGYDILSRFFGPWMGIAEDPVTGSAHAVLGPYWAPVLGKGTTPDSPITARQCSLRGGDLRVVVDEGARQVVLMGPAVVVLSGQLHA